MKILITGGNGYIAKSLFTGLSDKYDITTISRQDFDLTSYAQTARWFENKHFDVVIHTAIVGGMRMMVDDESVVNRNLQMYYNLVSLEDQFDRFITFGSGAEITMPWEPYGFSKRIIAESMSKRDKYYNLRIRAVFDQNELDTRFIKGNLLRYIKREPLLIHQNRYMDFFYMQDLVSLVDYYIKESDPNQEIDCRYECSLTLSEIAGLINTLSDYEVDVIVQNHTMAEPFVGESTLMPIEVIGLKKGIQMSYEKLKA